MQNKRQKKKKGRVVHEVVRDVDRARCVKVRRAGRRHQRIASDDVARRRRELRRSAGQSISGLRAELMYRYSRFWFCARIGSHVTFVKKRFPAQMCIEALVSS